MFSNFFSQMFSILLKTPITHDFNNHLYVSVCAKSLHKVLLFVTLWTLAQQAPLSTGFSRQERWGGLPWPPPGDLPDPGIKPKSPTAPACRQVLYRWATREAQSNSLRSLGTESLTWWRTEVLHLEPHKSTQEWKLQTRSSLQLDCNLMRRPEPEPLS